MGRYEGRIIFRIRTFLSPHNRFVLKGGKGEYRWERESPSLVKVRQCVIWPR